MTAPAENKSSDQPAALPRSPELMCREDTAILVVDVQQRLIVVQLGYKKVVWNIRRLLDAANALGVAAYATEQYPEKLGSMVTSLAERLETNIGSKLSFSCGDCGEIFAEWQTKGIHRVLVCGIETHVCVQQTVLDLLAAGYQVNLPVDAISSRFSIDREIAFRRMEASGAILTTTESAMFEWCVRSGTDEFKKISALAKELPPEGE
jgi:nicotinamidase-related amidase